MSSRGTSTSTSSRLNILSLNSKNKKKFSFKPHTDMTDTYSVVLPASIGSTDSTDKVLKIDSSANSSAICDWTYPGVEQHSTSTSPITFKVTVATKTSAHRYDGQGSTLGYLIDGKHSPYIDMIPGKTYRFDQSDSTNANAGEHSHPIKFYTTANKSEEYTTGVTTSSATIGTTGAHVEIVVSDSTPALLFYQCQSHVLMGNQIQVKGVGGSGGGSALTVKDETTALATAATTLKFVGDGVTASGTGVEKTITIPGGGGTSLPSQTGNANKFLKTDGSSLTWATASGSGSGGSPVYAHLQPVYDSSVSNNANHGIVTYRPFSSGAPLGSTSYSVGGITLDSSNQGIKLPSNGDYKMDFNINVRTVYTSTASEFTGALYKGSTVIQETFTFVRQVTAQATYESLNLTAIIKVEDYTTEVYYFKVNTDGNVGSSNSQIWGYDEGKGSQVTIMKVSDTGGSALTIQDEGSALDTAATTLNFVGSGVTAQGDGVEKTITISGGGGSSLLANPSTADKGKIVTVNAAGDDLEYGANFRELAFGQTIIRTAKKIEGLAERWLDLSSHNTSISDFNTDVSVNVAQGSRVKINCLTGVSTVGGNGIISFRLGKKVDGNVVWGSTNGVLTTRNDYQTDPKGDNEYSNKSENIGQNRIECWDFIHNEAGHLLYCVEPHFVDTNPTNGLSGTHTVTYFLRVRCEYPNSGDANDDFFINQDASGATTNQDRETCATILSVEEIGSGAITSFTQEQALAGAGGTAAFTIGGSSIHTGGSPPIFGTLSNLVDNVLDDVNGQLVVLNVSGGPWIVTFNFTTPQIVTKYRIWGRYDAGGGNYTQSPKNWELRAATDSSTYNASLSSTYTVLDSQSNAIFSSYVADNITASDNLSMANEYNLSTIGAYKYYVLHITGNGTHANYCTMSEIALYGGGFTIPSQIGHTGRLLTTDGTSLGWSTTTALPSVTVPEPTSTNKGRALVSTGTGIEFSDFNSGVSTGFKVYKSGTAFEEVTAGNTVLFDQTTTNVGAGSYSTTAGTYTVPVTGYYNIFANFEKLDVGFSCDLASTYDIDATGHHTITNWLLYSSGDIIPSYNINNNFNLSTGVFTSPCDGYYQANANIRIDGMSNYFRIYFSVNNQVDATNSGTGHNIAGNPATNYESLMSSQIIFLKKNNTLRVKIFSNSDNDWAVQSESSWSCHLIEQKSEFVLQKSTNSGSSYTDIKKAKNNLSETVYLNQNDLIRITSDSTNKLTFNQGDLNNSFGAHLLNSGNSTSPIPIYGFNAQKNDDHINPNGVITGWSITENSWNFSEPTSNFNTSSGLFTIPISGYYKVCAMLIVFSNGNSNNFRSNIIINGDTTAPYAGSFVDLINQDYGTINISTIIKLNKDDTIGISGGNNGTIKGGTSNTNTSTFSCFLLASDTQTNTRQMGLSPIVPLHQLGHDQFADGVFSIMEYSSSADTGNIDNRSIDGDKLSAITSSNITSYKLSDSSISTVKYNLGSTDYTTVPGSPHTNWTDSTDYIEIELFNDSSISLNNFFTTGSFTIDLSKILTNFVGLWNVGFEWDNDLRININNEMFYFDDHFGHNLNPAVRRYKNININNRYINCTFNHQEDGGGQTIKLSFYRICSISQQAIAEPVMPSITLPTPNSNNNGKVLVSNGSGYALQPNSGYVPVYGFFVEKTGDVPSTANGTIGNWNKNGSNHFTLPSNNYNLTTGVYTIPVSGYYQVNATIRVNNNAGNRVYVSVNNDTSTSGANITLSNFQDTNDKEAWLLNGVLKLNINDTIELKVQYSGLNIDHDDTHWSCMLLNTTEVNATPSINIPLPVAAHAGKSLTVNSQGTGLEYDDSGIVLQIQKTLFTDSYYASGLTNEAWHNLSQLNTNITPKYNNSLILINVNIGRIDCDDSSTVVYKIMRDNSDIQSIGDDNVRATWSSNERHQDDNHAGGVSFTIFDSPNTTNQVTYKLFYDVEGDKIVVNTNMNQGRSNTVLSGFLHAKTMSNMILTEIKQ